MMMNFTTGTLATLLLVVANVSSTSASIRGVVKKTIAPPQRAWSVHPNDNTRRRLKLEHNNTCLLLLKDIQFEDHTIEEDNWVCEFPYSRAKSDFNSREFMDIDVPKDVIDAMNPTSGASVLKTRGAYVEESIDTHVMRMHIPDDAEMEVINLPTTDPRHYKQRRLKRDQAERKLADSNPGSLSVLVVRVIDASGAKLSATDEELVDDFFTDEFSLKTGYAQCSKDQLIIEPATGNGVSNGIVTVNVGVNANAGRSSLQQEALAQANEQLGSLSNKWDLVMFCQPPGSGNWLAYAYINSWVSFYNDRWCRRVSAQMHEVGHNLGLGHSNEGETAYGDQSALMGYSYDSDDGPKMCFNAAKNFQLGWYERQKQSFYPLQNKDTTQKFVLNGINDYKTTGSTDGKLVTLRIVEYGDEYDTSLGDYGNDYYVGYNRKTGPNSGTLEAGNKVVIFRKDKGGPDNYGESNRIADLSPGDTYQITDFAGKPVDVTIRYKSLTGNGQDANIEIITLGDGVPTMAPTASCGGVGRFQLDLKIDTYAFETAWELIDDDTNDVFYDETNDIYATAPKENHFANKEYTYPVDGPEYYCLTKGCYTFKITDTYGDGLSTGQGGSYVGSLDDDVAFQGDGQFDYEDVRKFCVGGGNNNPEPITKAPTMKPSKAPTNKPTKSPTNKPTNAPTNKPTNAPTNKPTKAPTKKPTKYPTSSPTEFNDVNTESPTTASPTTSSPTQSPTVSPTSSPTSAPTTSSTASPTNQMTEAPTNNPTNAPSIEPTKAPTKAPIDNNNDGACEDDANFLWKGQTKKNCKWVGKGTDPKIVKKCKRSNADGLKVRDYCPKTCAKVGQGSCA